MLSNQKLTLKTTITTILGTGGTFEIYETGIELTSASIVFRDSVKLERFVVNIATTGVCTIVLRGLDQTQTKTEVSGNKKERLSGAEGYVTVLAFDIVDKDNTGDTQVLGGGYSFTGNVSVANLTATGYIRDAVYANATARDTDIPSPQNGMRVYNTAVGLYQKYQAGAWIDDTGGASVPNLSETVTGKGRYANDVQFDAGTDTDGSGNPLLPKPSQVLKSRNIEALVDSTFLTGENVTANDSLFAETGPTFAQATLVQNIGDVAASTRVVLYDFGSGVSGSTYKLGLKKFSSPSPDLSVRLETIDGSGNATGTLVNANATALVTAASLTTSIVDTTITFAGSFIIPLGQKFAIVLKQVGNVVNAINYYGVAVTTLNTTTRTQKRWNGSSWLDGGATVAIDDYGDLTAAGYGSSTSGVVISTNSRAVSIRKITKDSQCDATGVQVYAYLNTSTLGSLLGSASFTGDIASFGTEVSLSANTSYVLITTGESNFVRRNAGSQLFGVNVNFIAGWDGSQGSNYYDITKVETVEYASVKVYTSSTLSLPILLSKTDTDFEIKLPNDFPRFAKTTASAGASIPCYRKGIVGGFTGLTKDSIYYLTGTPGGISTTPGANRYCVGKAISTTEIDIDGLSDMSTNFTTFNLTNSGTGGYIYSNTYIASKNTIINLTLSSNNASNAAKLQVSNDGITRIDVLSAVNTTITTNSSMIPGRQYRIGLTAIGGTSASSTVSGNVLITL